MVLDAHPSGTVPSAHFAEGTSTGEVSYRPFRSGDVDAIVEAFSASWDADELTVPWLTTNVLLDPNFDPLGFTIASDERGMLGAAYAVAVSVDTPGLDPVGGWIPLLFVRPDARRAGIGRELADRSMRYLRDRGAQWVNVSGYGPAYLTPGVDLDASPEGVSLFRSLGFDEVEAPVSMRLDLADYAPADGSLAAAAVADGFTFAPCAAGDLPEVIRFAAEVTSGDWGVVLRDSVIRHGAPDRIRIARSPQGAIVGFATFGSYEGVLERFGPFGVDPEFRGRALGKILLHDTLGAMKARGVTSAWFLWTDPESAAGRLYAQLGFTVARRFSVVQRDL